MKSYEQVAKEALRLLAEQPEVVFFAESERQAKSWQRGFYYMRKKQQRDSLNGETPYDAMLICVEGEKVTIKWQPQLTRGESL